MMGTQKKKKITREDEVGLQKHALVGEGDRQLKNSYSASSFS
jgi:hypothetical protein